MYFVLYSETLTPNVADRKRLYNLAVHHRIQLVGNHGANIASSIAELATPSGTTSPSDRKSQATRVWR